MVAREVFGLQEQEHAPARLATDRGALRVVSRARQQKRRATPGRRDHDPTLRRRERGVVPRMCGMFPKQPKQVPAESRMRH